PIDPSRLGASGGKNFMMSNTITLGALRCWPSMSNGIWSQCGASIRSPRMRMAVTWPHGVQPIACANFVLISVTPSPVSKRNVPAWPRIEPCTVVRWSPNGYGSKWMTATGVVDCAAAVRTGQTRHATRPADRATENRVMNESNLMEREAWSRAIGPALVRAAHRLTPTAAGRFVFHQSMVVGHDGTAPNACGGLMGARARSR